MKTQSRKRWFRTPLTGGGRWSCLYRCLLAGLLLLGGWTFAHAAVFSQSATFGEAPLTVVFTDESSEPDDYSRRWDFGDGKDSMERSPTHVSQNVGVHEVVLTLTSPAGETSTARGSVTVTQLDLAPPPVASFTSDPASGSAPLTVSFTDTSTGQINTYFWTFGDGDTSTSQSPQHTYDKPGNYSVLLTVTGNGGTSESTSTIKVLASAVLAWQAVPDTRVVGYEVHYGTASQTYGSVVSTSTISATVPGLEVGQTYYFAVKSRGSSSSLVSEFSDEVSATIGVAAPQAAFRSSVAQGVAPLRVQFTDESTGQASTRQWMFGDGASSTAQSPEHVYQVPGEYQVVFRVNGPGGSSVRMGTIKVLTPQPVAKIRQSAKTGTSPLEVTFIDASTWPVTSRQWNFGDGTTSTSDSPTHVYAEPGKYTTVLKVQGPGGSAQASAVTTVLWPKPVADFTQSSTSGLAPLAVVFTDTSTGNITSYSWNFGDGTTSTVKSPTHVFSAAGTYNIVLTVTGPGGISSKTGATTTVSAPPPVAAFTQTPTSGIAPLSVAFIDASTSGGPVSSYLWKFGDGTTSTAKSPTHVYAEAGVYAAVLTVTGPGGTSSKTGVTTSVLAPPPVANFTQSTTSGPAPLAVSFADASTGGRVTSYSWRFGDGATSTAQSPTHVFSAPGSYNVVLTVMGPGGSSSKTGVTTTILAPPPVASFTHTPASGTAPLDVAFNDTSTGSISAYLWTFGDGTTSTLKSPAHTYVSAGNYTVSLTVTGDGGTSTKTGVVQVLPAKPVAGFTEDVTSGKAPLTVHFSATTTGTVNSYSWSFGDGGISTAKDALYTYTKAGTYSVSLTVTGSGGSDTLTKTDLIRVDAPEVPPVADFSADKVDGDAPLSVAFQNKTTDNASQFAWEFGDGTTSSESNPVHVYVTPGTYSVKLTATGPAGSHTAQKTGYISVKAPVVPGVLAVESGTLRVDKTWQSVAFKKTFTDPIVVASALSFNNAEPAVVRIDGITKNAFRIRVQEWDYLDGTHPAETVNFLVVERGRHQLPGGAWIEAGRMNASGGSSWTLQSFASPFTTVPVMFTAVVSNQDDTAVTTRLRAVKAGSFQVRLQKQERIANAHGPESVNWIAWQASSGTLDGLKFKVAKTASLVTDLPFALSFKADLSGVPAFLAAMQTVASLDSAALRWTDLSANGAKVWVQEEQSLDTEVTHPAESIGWAVFQSTSTPTTPPVAAFSADKVIGDAPLSVTFQNQTTGNASQFAWEFGDGGSSSESNPIHVYANPGFYTVKLTASGSGGSNVLQKAEFITVKPPVVPGALVVESGTVSVDSNWQWVAFKKTFADPIVVAGGLSYKDAESAVVRMERIDRHGFWVRVQEWDYLNGTHAAETVNFLVVERGRHQLSTGAWIEAGQINASGGSRWDLQSFTSPFSVMPALFTSIVSTTDTTAVTTRLRQVKVGSFQVRLQKQENIMNAHGSESVNWIAWQPSSGTVDGLKFRVGKTASRVTNLPFALSFKAGLSGIPVFIVSIQTVRALDSAVLRWSDLSAAGVKAWVQEEQSLDAEVTHPSESMGWAVFE